MFTPSYLIPDQDCGELLRQLAPLEPTGVAKNIDLQHFVTAAMDSNLPPWRPVPSRSAAQMLGVQLQSLANWRMRDVGPKSEPWKKGGGNRTYYRPDRLAEWLSGGRCTGWQFSACWLEEKGIPVNMTDQRAVYARIQWMESQDLFPPAHRLWRSFRETEPG